jgi:hypothetical protein
MTLVCINGVWREGEPHHEHHLWCNLVMGPPEKCRMCEGLWARYPYSTNEEADGLAAKYFPNAIRRT